jgi:hypothetical protein
MHVQDHSGLGEDSIKAFHAGNLLKDIIQAEDDSYTKKEASLMHTVCTSLQVADTGDIATMHFSPASICTLAIIAGPSAVGIPDVGFVIDNIEGEDDFSDEYPLAIEVKTEKQEYAKEPLYRDLYRVYRECSESDWDNDGADPINEQTFLEAVMLLDQLPSELPLPEVIPEPTGNIAFEWYKGKRNVYVISIGGKSTIEYAGLFGRHSKTYGAEYFSDELPGLIVSHILRLFS